MDSSVYRKEVYAAPINCKNGETVEMAMSRTIAYLQDQLEREKTLFMIESETHKYDLMRIAELEADLATEKKALEEIHSRISVIRDIVKNFLKVLESAYADKPR